MGPAIETTQVTPQCLIRWGAGVSQEARDAFMRRMSAIKPTRPPKEYRPNYERIRRLADEHATDLLTAPSPEPLDPAGKWMVRIYYRNMADETVYIVAGPMTRAAAVHMEREYSDPSSMACGADRYRADAPGQIPPAWSRSRRAELPHLYPPEPYAITRLDESVRVDIEAAEAADSEVPSCVASMSCLCAAHAAGAAASEACDTSEERARERLEEYPEPAVPLPEVIPLARRALGSVYRAAMARRAARTAQALCLRCSGSGVVTERAADSGDATNTDCPCCDGRGKRGDAYDERD